MIHIFNYETPFYIFKIKIKGESYMSILEIIEELNLENGTKYKESVLVKHKNNELFKRVLKMTYDKVIYTYGVTMKNIV